MENKNTMRFFRNPEIQKSLLLQIGALLLFSFLGLFLSPKAGLLVCFVCLFYTLFFLLTTRLRYEKLAHLSRDLDAMLHDQRPVCFQEYEEGELSILQNELSKITLRLTESANALLEDKKYLADSLADISHQIRSPLTSIRLILSLLSEPDLPAMRRRELLRELAMLSDRIDWLVEALLKMSRMDAGTVTLSQTTVPVSKVLEEAAAPLLIPMELREQTLVMDAKTGTETFQGDLAWSVEAVLNILKNCMEHTPAGGSIHISCRENAIFTEIIIRDNGPGFSPEDLPRLFERFYKGENASEHSIGIGLALARMIISRQNGTIKAENAIPHGAQFAIKFYHQVF